MTYQSEDLTPWFPGCVKPVRNGWYQLDAFGEIWTGWWNGSDWYPYPASSPYVFQRRPWRGLAQPPKES